MPRLVHRIAQFLERRLTNKLVPALEARIEAEIKIRLAQICDQYFESKQGNFRQLIEQIINSSLGNQKTFNSLLGYRIYCPNEIVAGSMEGPYMIASNPLSRDFLHPEFAEFCKIFHHPIITHRKLWEWAFIYHHVLRAGVIAPGNRGLGFGVGCEQLPSLFASLGIQVTATDAPLDRSGWVNDNQYSNGRDDLFHEDIVDRNTFDRSVSFEAADMNNIPSHLSGFDFCWSSCALEHLGSLQHGIDFITNSVEKTLRIGGLACHTTELNLSSDEETVESGPTVLYRKQDLERLCQMLKERGHDVNPLRIEPGNLIADYLIDVPPFREDQDPHLKLELGQYVSTSVGIVARRGR